MPKKTILFILLSAFFVLVSCGTDKKNKLMEDTKKVAGEINSVFVKSADVVSKIDKAAEDVYTNINNYDVSVDKMDVKDGGKYDVFDGKVYYKVKDDGGAAIWSSGYIPANDFIRKRVKIMEFIEPALIENQKDLTLPFPVWYTDINSILMTYPYQDLISSLPAGINVQQLPVYALGMKDNNPDKKLMYTPGVFAGLAGGIGWMMTVFAPTYLDDEMNGIVSSDIIMKSINKKYLTDNENMLMFVSNSDILIGASNICKNELNLKILEDIDYLEQFQKNPQASEEYKLSHDSQGKGLNTIAEKMKLESEFEIEINNINYIACVEKIEEVGFYLIGLVKK